MSTSRPDGLISVLARVRDWLGASPSEMAGLALLVAGSVAVATILLLRAPRPDDLVPPGPVTVVPTGAATVTVHVAGAVHEPGLVELPEGSRVSDAIDRAGGLTVVAIPDALNLARRVTDGEQLVVPALGTGPGDPGGAADAHGAGSAVRPDGRLDLNRATAEDFEELPGIGPVLAERIVAWRDEHGPFTDPGQLREVPGIGERTFQQLADLVTV